MAGGSGVETLIGGDGNDRSTATRATIRASGCRRRPSSGIRATVATRSRARTAPTRCSSTARASPSSHLSANGNRLRFFRDIGTITMDTAGVERVDLNALGAADLVTVNDLAAPTSAGQRRPRRHPAGRRATARPTGRRERDRATTRSRSAQTTTGVTASGACAHCRFSTRSPATSSPSTGSPAPTDRRLPVSRAERSGSPWTAVRATTRSPAARASRPRWRRRERPIDGNKGNDLARLGAGDDPSSGIRATVATRSRARTAPTRCSSTARACAEQVDLSANGNRLRFFRDIATITMDTAGVERST